jgi:hypothetical protein
VSAATLNNADLAIATIVRRMEFTTDLGTGRCSFVLELVDDDRPPTARIVAEADGVSEWSVLALGGGITQMLCLRARDVSDLQHDRVRFVLADLENEALSLKCEELATRRVLVDG